MQIFCSCAFPVSKQLVEHLTPGFHDLSPLTALCVVAPSISTPCSAASYLGLSYDCRGWTCLVHSTVPHALVNVLSYSSETYIPNVFGMVRVLFVGNEEYCLDATNSTRLLVPCSMRRALLRAVSLFDYNG